MPNHILSDLSTVPESSSIQAIINPIAERLITFIAENKDKQIVERIGGIIKDGLDNLDQVHQLYDVVEDLAKDHPELQNILKDFAKLPFFTELKTVGDVATREHDDPSLLAVADVVTDEDDEDEKKRRDALNQQAVSQNINYHHNYNSEEFDLSKLVPILAKMSATLAIALAVPGAGFLLAGLFLYATRNIANGKEINHIGNDSSKNGDELMREFLRYRNQEAQTHTGKKADEAASDMKKDTKASQEVLTEQSSQLKDADAKAKSANHPDFSIRVDTADKGQSK